jgi:long-chain acyl-CoA synthetase
MVMTGGKCVADVRNVSELVSRAASRHPDKSALVAGSRTVTWGELETAVATLAAGLVARGLQPGDRVGLLQPNGIDFAVAYFGVLRAGFVALPLNTAYTANEIGYQLSDSGAALVIASGSHAHLAAPSEVEVVTVGTDAWTALNAAGGESLAKARGGAEDTAVLLYTSGTSGRPKGAMLSHRALLANLSQLAQIEPAVIAPDDRVLLVLPLFHVYGLNAGLGMTAYVGATGVVAERFDPVETLRLVDSAHVSNIVGAPPMYVSWSMLPRLSESLASLRLAVSGSAPLPPDVLSAILDGTGHHVFEGYGLTETAPVLTTSLCSEVAKPGSIGRPIPGVELRLLDDQGEETDEGDPGEIVVRGANLFSGYWPDGSGGPDADGWFRTGDVAVADDDGDLFLVDRVRELILVSGFNVYPREVEDVIAGHADVDEVAVIGIAHPYTGETVKAFVVPRPGTAPTADDVIEYAARRLARFKCPTAVEIVSELPHSATGKVAKGRLRDSA